MLHDVSYDVCNTFASHLQHIIVDIMHEFTACVISLSKLQLTQTLTQMTRADHEKHSNDVQKTFKVYGNVKSIR